VSRVEWLLVLVLTCGLPLAVWVGIRLEREQTRMRGEHALRVFRDLTSRDPWAGIHPEPFERLLRKATGLPDTDRKTP
jgi:hypothetical protein